MREKKLKRLRRAELIEIIYEQQKRNEENEARIAQLEAALNERRLCLANAGSIAEAALKLNGVFSAAQAAAEQYLQSVQELIKEKAEENAKQTQENRAADDGAD